MPRIRNPRPHPHPHATPLNPATTLCAVQEEEVRRENQWAFE